MALLENLMSGDVIWRLGWTLLHFIWQATALALLLAIVLQFLRKSAASLRYGVACLVLALMAVLGLATLFTVSLTPTGQLALSPVLPGAETLPLETTAPLATVPASADLAIEPPVSWQQRFSQLAEPTLPYIVLAWLLGVVTLSLRHVGAWVCLQRLRRKHVRPVAASLEQTLSRLARQLKVSRPVQLVESALVQIPTVIGWVRPVILLPATALTGLTTSQIEAMLAHELAHIRRFDYMSNMLQVLVETLGFYHPAVWWISRTIRSERENCCDDLAVRVCGDPKGYAQALAEMEEIRCHQTELALAASGGKLINRISRLLGRDIAQETQRFRVHALIVVALLLTVAIPATLAFSHAQQEDSVPAVISSSDSATHDALPPASSTDTNQGQILVECVVYDAPADFKLPRQEGARGEPRVYIDNAGGNWRQGSTAKALQHKDVKVWASPKVICLDGKPAEIAIGQEIPYDTGTTTHVVSSEQSASRGKMGHIFEGIQLEMTPKIAPNNTVILNLDLTQTEVVFTSAPGQSESPQRVPVTQRRACATQVCMKSEHTLVIDRLSSSKGPGSQTILLLTPRVIRADPVAEPSDTLPGEPSSLDVAYPQEHALPPTPVSSLEPSEPTSVPVTPANPLAPDDAILPTIENAPSDTSRIDLPVSVQASPVSPQQHVKVFALKYVDSEYVTSLLQQLLGASTVRLARDARTNRVFALANPSELEQVENLIAIIDQAALKNRVSPATPPTNASPLPGAAKSPGATGPVLETPAAGGLFKSRVSTQRMPGVDNLTWRREMKRQRMVGLQSELFSTESTRIQLESDIRLRGQSTLSGMSLQEKLKLCQDYVNSDPSIRALAEKITQVEMDVLLARQDSTEQHPELKKQIQLLADLKQRLNQQKEELLATLDDMITAQAKQNHQRQLAALRQQLEQSRIYQDRLQEMLAAEEKELVELEAQLAAEQKRRKRQKTPGALLPTE